MTQPRLVFELIDLPTGNLTLMGLHVGRWGSEIIIDCLYRYPPEEKSFRLIFRRCSALECFVARQDIEEGAAAQLLTHDLGAGNHQRTARFASVMGEIIISYGDLVAEKGW